MVSAPEIQKLGVAFDNVTKNKQIEISTDDSYKMTLTGSWSGDTSNLSTTLTVNGQVVTIPNDSFHEDGTFSIPLDLKPTGKIGENSIHLEISDGKQTVGNDAVLVLTQTNTPPEIKLSDTLKGVNVSPSDKTLTIKGQWKDRESSAVSLFYQLNGVESSLMDNISNTTKDTWTDFSKDIPLGKLHLGKNQVEVYAKDVEGQISDIGKFIIILNQGSIKFKTIASEIQFKDLYLVGRAVGIAASHNDGIAIEDTKGQQNNWQLTVKQTTPFTNGKWELSAQLYYQNDKDALLLSNTPVTLPTVQNQNNTTEYLLPQDSNHGFQLVVPAGAHAGEYQSEFTWTIVTAP